MTLTFRLQRIALWLNRPANADLTIALGLAAAVFIGVIAYLAL